MTQRRSPGIGLALLGIGLALFLGRVGLWEVSSMWRAWPLLLVGMGALLWWEKSSVNATGLGFAERFLAIAITATGFAVSFGFVVTGPRSDKFEHRSPVANLAALELETREARDLECAAGRPLEFALVGVAVEIRPAAHGRCRVAVATAAGDAEAPALTVSEGGNSLLIGLDNPTERIVRLTFEIPAGTELRGSLHRGELDAEGVGSINVSSEGTDLRLRGTANLTLRVATGSISAEGIDGRVELEAMNTSVNLTGVSGPVVIHSLFSRLRLTETASSVEVTADAGSVAVTRAAGTVVVRSERSDVNISGASGHVQIAGSDANIHLDDSQGGAEITMIGGWLRAGDIQGAFSLNASPRRASLSRIVGALEIRTTGTILSVQSCAGTINLEQEGGTAQLRRNEGNAQVRARDSELELELVEGGSVDAVTERTNVTLSLGSENLGVEVTTDRGAIRVEPESQDTEAAEASPVRALKLPGNPIAARISATDGIVRIRR